MSRRIQALEPPIFFDMIALFAREVNQPCGQQDYHN